MEDVTCHEGEKVSLECLVAGGKKPSKWYKEGDAVLSDHIKDESKDQSYKLTFLRVTRKDAGDYEVKIGDEVRVVRLNVIGKEVTIYCPVKVLRRSF